MHELGFYKEYKQYILNCLTITRMYIASTSKTKAFQFSLPSLDSILPAN